MSIFRRAWIFVKDRRLIVFIYAGAALIAIAGFNVGYLYAKREPLPIVIEKCSEKTEIGN